MEPSKFNQNICRICLEDNVTVNWNEEIEISCGFSYKDCYYKYTKIPEDDTYPLPINLCAKCCSGLKNAHLLFEKAYESYKNLCDDLFAIELESDLVNGETMKFKIKFIDDRDFSDRIEQDTLTNDATITNVEEELLDHTSDYDNEQNDSTENNIHNSITREIKMSEDETIENLPKDKMTSGQEFSKSSYSNLSASSSATLVVNDRSSLKVHESTHSENRKRSETCPQCGLKFYTKMALRNHMDIHAQNREKKFKCEFCVKAFFNRGALNVHRRIHLGQMIPCKLCPKEFYRQIDLDKHLAKHSTAPLHKKAEKSKYTVQCQYCNETVATAKWKTHKAIHLNQPPVKCKVCDKEFFSRDRVVRHLRKVHGKTIEEYDEFIEYLDSNIRMSHLMIQQQEIKNLLKDEMNLSNKGCRICLKGKVLLNWNEEIDDISGMTYRDCYYKYTELQSIDSDPLPPNLCRTCCRGLKNAYLLFQKAIESFNILHNTLKTPELKPISCVKEEISMEFEHKILGDYNLDNLINEDTIKDKNLEEEEEEESNSINYDSNNEISSQNEEEIAPVDFIDIKNYESSAEDLLEERTNADSNTESAVDSTTLKVEHKNILIRHEAIHNKNRQRTETCPHCKLKFYNKLGLNNHIKIHDVNREKRFKCEFCDKAFFNRGGLNVHRRIHLGQMVACKLCPKEFYRQIDLDRHLLGHSAGPLQTKVSKVKYEVQCQYCDKSVNSAKWKQHKAAHLGQPQVKCKICEKTFFAKKNCTKHLKQVHQKTRDEYEQFIHYYVVYTQRMSHLMIQQQEKVQLQYLPRENKLLLYKVTIRSVLLYGFPIWFTISPIVAKELEIFERKILRKCINKHYVSHTKKYSNTYIYDTSEVQPFCKYALRHQRVFVEKLATHENSLMNEIHELERSLQWSSSTYLSPVVMEPLKFKENICRICLEDNGTQNWNEEIEILCGFSYKDCYYKYTELQADDSDHLPTNLCATCSSGLKNAHLLFEKAFESYKILNEMIFTIKEECDVSIGSKETTMKFEINVIDDYDTTSNDTTYTDIDEELMNATNDNDNEQDVSTEYSINNSIFKEITMSEGETIENQSEQEYSETLEVKELASLKLHESTHCENRKRTEACPQCGLKFYTKNSLRTHMDIHAKNREKKFKCEFCIKAFFNRGALNVHRRIHLGQMIACKLCSKEFCRQVDLDKHLAKHSTAPLHKKAEKSKYTVQCQYCNESVATTKWKTHKAIHLNQPPVKCKVCNKDFFARSRVVEHLRRVHGKTIEEYDELIEYLNPNIRMSHLMIRQQETVVPILE
ncbi:Zinc finger protein 271 [Lucilia cuprina]|nr:Zinc finger protein 271 [Lucilia cuprina]